MNIIGHLFIILFLTLISQVGGIIWVLVLIVLKLIKKFSALKQVVVFIAFYLCASFFIIPPIAKLYGRVPLPVGRSGSLIAHNILSPLLNRHYVKDKLKNQLINISLKFNSINPELKVSYLDAGFPFIDGFPLPPHLSHNDGRKVDLSFYYTKAKISGNLKPSNLGYGRFVEPIDQSKSKVSECKSKGYWQYDYNKYFTFGSRNDLEFDEYHTKKLIELIAEDPLTDKILIEPHLKERLQLKSSKIRFQGCQSVRHDDHIHYQIHKK